MNKATPLFRSVNRPIMRFTMIVLMLVVSHASPAPWAHGDQPLLSLEQAAIKAAAAKVAECVVRIDTVGGLETVDRVLISTAPTTGVIVDADGFIVSSAFNFVQKPASILVTLTNGERHAARMVAQDHSRNIVLLKIDVDSRLPVPTATSRDQMQVGQWCLALGRTFGDQSPSVSVGILSATNRIWGRAIQTDCKVSPANYGGPLVDIQGRVLGILLPLSPEQTSETAGVEWYDSGVAFAVPMVDVFAVLDRLKQGESLYRGLLGITLKGKNVFADPAIVATAPAGTPAAAAGLAEDDLIVRLEDRQIQRQAELKQAMGPRYAGESVQLTVVRNGKQHQLTATLTDKIAPYQLPMMGVLPVRGTDDMKVRAVLPNTPADKAGIQRGDVLVGLNGNELTGTTAWRDAVAGFSPNESIQVEWIRNEKKTSAQLILATNSDAIPPELPPATPLGPADNDQPPTETGLLAIKIPESINECFCVVPDDYDRRVPHGVVVWLGPPDDVDNQLLTERWKLLAAKHDLLVLAPRAVDRTRWLPTEVDFIRKSLDEVARKFHVDSNRIVIHGHQAGASLGFLVAFRNRDVVRAVAAVDAAIPKRMRLRSNDPVERLSFYFQWNADSPVADRIKQDVTALRQFKFPVTIVEDSPNAYLSSKELSDLARWTDALDRI